jgi:hypothetical protein
MDEFRKFRRTANILVSVTFSEPFEVNWLSCMVPCLQTDFVELQFRERFMLSKLLLDD